MQNMTMPYYRVVGQSVPKNGHFFYFVKGEHREYSIEEKTREVSETGLARGANGRFFFLLLLAI